MLNCFVRPVLKRTLRGRKSQYRGNVVFPRMVAPVFDTTTRHALVDGWYDATLLRHVMDYVSARRAVAEAVCLDVGANVGFHTLHYAQTFGRVYAFEPNPYAFDLLVLNLRYSGKTNVQTINAAIAPQGKRYRMVEDEAWNSGECYLVETGQEDTRVTPGTVIKAWGPDELERMLRADNPPVAYVKIDVEGGEAAVLDVLASVLRQHRPIVGFEIHTRDDLDGILRSLSTIGFDLNLVFDATKNRTIPVSKLRDRFYPLLAVDLAKTQ